MRYGLTWDDKNAVENDVESARAGVVDNVLDDVVDNVEE